MSIENAKSFYLRVTRDEEFRVLLEQILTVEERQQTIKAAGYEFTAEEWETFCKKILVAADANEKEELNDLELADINAGMFPSSINRMSTINWDKICFFP